MDTALLDDVANAAAARDERRRQLGIDCAASVTWKQWEVGVEAAKRLRIQNVDSTPLVVEYSLPTRKTTFEVPFPEPQTLGSGMAFDLVIRFCPTTFVEYNDSITITVRGRGSFSVQLVSLLPFARLGAPSKIDFNYIAVSGVAKLPFRFTNEGTVPLQYRWEIPSPFSISHREGELGVGETVTATVTFAPTQACVALAQAVCYSLDCDDEILGFTRVSGIGKYPYVCVAGGSNTVDFGDVTAGATSTREVSLENKTAVPAVVAIRRVDVIGRDNGTSGGGAVTLSPTRFLLESGQALPVSITYTPSIAETPSAVDYVLEVAGGNSLRLTVRGNCIAPVVSISAQSLNYGDVNLDLQKRAPTESNPRKQATQSRSSVEQKQSSAPDLSKLIVLKNHSDVAVNFQFAGMSPGAAFVVEPSNGKLLAGGAQKIRVTFCPTHPINYLRRVFLLVAGSVTTLTLDLYGSAYDSETRPLPFGPREVDAFFTRGKLGLFKATPGQLADAAAFPHADYLRTIRESHGNTNSAGTEKQVDVSQQLQNLLVTANMEETRAPDERKRGRITDLSCVFSENDVVDAGPLAATFPFSLDKTVLTFSGTADTKETPGMMIKSASPAVGNVRNYNNNNNASVLARASRMSHGESERFDGSPCQVVTVYNHTESDGLVWWCAPTGAPWRVSPSTAEVPAHSSTCFRVFLDWSLCESDRRAVIAAKALSSSPADTVGTREPDDSAGKGGALNRTGERKANQQLPIDEDGAKNLRGSRTTTKKSDRSTAATSGYHAAAGAAASPATSSTSPQQHAAVASSLECYVNFKEMRSFRTVPDKGFTPPQCLLVQCQYDPAGADGVAVGSIPKVKFSNRVVMPPCLVGRNAYAVVPVTNERDVPTLFSLGMTSFVAASDSPVNGHGNSAPAPLADGVSGGAYAVNDTKVLTAIAAWDRLTQGYNRSPDSYYEDSASFEQPQSSANDEKYVSVAGVFDFYPRGGIIGPRQTQFIVIKFTPPDESGFLGVLRIALGGSSVDSEPGAADGGGTDASANGVGSNGLRGTLTDADQNGSSVGSVIIRGYGSVPRISVNVGPKLYFRPTCVSGRTERKITVRNEAGVPTQCSLGSVSATLAGVIHVDPPTATILGGYQEGVWTVSFAPNSVGEFRGQLTLCGEQVPTNETEGSGKLEALMIMNQQQQQQQQQQLHSEHAGVYDEVALQVLGEAVRGEVDIEPAELAFGAVVEGRHVTRTFGIFNSGVCDLYYEVRWRALTRHCDEHHGGMFNADDVDEDGYMFTTPSPACLPSLIHSSGKLNARTETTVQVTLVAQEGIESYIMYVVVGGTPESLCVSEPSTLRELRRHPHCMATFTSQQPLVTVVDVRSAQVRRSVLWEQFSVNEINAVLSVRGDTDADASAVGGSAASVIECEIGNGGTLGADPVCVRVCLRNTGGTDAIIAIRLPTDHGVPKETWFDVDPSLETVQHIVDEGIITVSPSSGVIPPGGTLNVDISYIFKEPGVHRLPVVFQLENGPQTTLVLTGSTTPPSVGVLAVHPSHVLAMIPVPIGDLEPPMQYAQLENPTAHPVEYAVDEDGLARIAQQNYNFPVFHCVNPVGVVPPFSHVQLAWYFRPLEAKTYTASVAIRVSEGEDIIYSLRGEGYHPGNVSRERRREMCQNAFMPIAKGPFLSNPGTPLCLSYDVLSFGSLPFFSFRRSTCTLINTDPTDTFEFAWDSRLTAFGDCVVDVAPQTGSIRPGERVEFRVCMYAGCGSHKLESSVLCNVQRIYAGGDEGSNAPEVPIELFVQALVMPIEQYTAIYGEESTKSFAFPTLHSFAAPHVDPMQCVTRPEKDLLCSVIDEVVKGAIVSHSVQSALSDPADDDVPFYVPRAHNNTLFPRATTAMNTTMHSQPTLPLLYDVIEGIFESVVHDLVGPCLQSE